MTVRSGWQRSSLSPSEDCAKEAGDVLAHRLPLRGATLFNFHVRAQMLDVGVELSMPCMDAVPRWEALWRKYGKKWLRLVVAPARCGCGEGRRGALHGPAVDPGPGGLRYRGRPLRAFRSEGTALRFSVELAGPPAREQLRLGLLLAESHCRTCNVYPWGKAKPTARRARFDQDWSAGTKKVKSHPVGANGLYDMAGNVWELVEDCYDSDIYNSRSGTVTSNPHLQPKGYSTSRGIKPLVPALV
ncbi:MAG: SUMF1/EgtB/PvdO family nonheme iron enzyme [Myxococcales bacterium]|nr:SUMF1/EgtB/PvdO family nonheme iron enzyme [Myxococcales bacterium]